MSSNLKEAKFALDKVIKKARVHLYKPIQIAEILYHDRVVKDVNLNNLESYRTKSRKWRDIICSEFLGRCSTSSARYQDDVFNENAMPPHLFEILGKENRAKKGIVEAYIYINFKARYTQMSTGLGYCLKATPSSFQVKDFLNLFWQEPGLRRSIDKMYEIVVYSLFSVLVDALNISVEVSLDKDKSGLLREFQDFAQQILSISEKKPCSKTSAKFFRVGVTNASDRGLDMWANFGVAVQIKHLSLTEELAESIVESVSADRIIIVCKDSEEKMILSLLNQMGWKARIQSIVTEGKLAEWYEKALRGGYKDVLGKKLLKELANQIASEFPSAEPTGLIKFISERRYDKFSDAFWK
ncbi:MAG: HaeII family restriction endonuclease [Candidatus Omnitrophota bacterium]